MHVLGIDIGGTKIAMGLVDEAGRVHEKKVFASKAHLGRESMLRRIVEQIRSIDHKVGVDVLGIGFPGTVMGKQAVILESVNVPGWQGVALKDLFQEQVGKEVFVENDANAAALGEWMVGAGQGTQDFVYLTISTGIGAGILSQGKLITGVQGYAGELGHTILQKDGPRCRCGNHGCWEALASGPAMARSARVSLEQDKSSLMRIKKNFGAKDVFIAYEAHDQLATEIVEKAAAWSGLGLYNLIRTLNPERIAIGGGVGLGSARFVEKIKETVLLYARSPLLMPEIVPAHLKDEAGIIGSACVARYGLGYFPQGVKLL